MSFIRSFLMGSVLAAIMQRGSAQASDASWAWKTLESQGSTWAVTDGAARVKLSVHLVDIDLLAPNSNEIECKMRGTVSRPVTHRGVSTKMIRAKALCVGNEMGENDYTGKIMNIGAAAAAKKYGLRQVIMLDDGFGNIIALTHGK
jgi:hypothetical protein